MAIQIAVSLWGNLGVAEGAGLRVTGRTLAEALSVLVGKMARDKDLLGQPWECPENGLRGVVGQSGKRRQPRKFVNVADLGLEGGRMRRDG